MHNIIGSAQNKSLILDTDIFLKEVGNYVNGIYHVAIDQVKDCLLTSKHCCFIHLPV